MGLFERLLDRLQGEPARPLAPRRYRCRCGQPVFFDNTTCLACGAALGFDPERLVVRALADAEARCANFEPVQCNWVADAGGTLCRACALNRTVPDASDPRQRWLWQRVEQAKRRLVSQLVALELPLDGLRFDFLQRAPDAPVTMGHAGGVITIDLDEADEARRAQVQSALAEPYRTLLGHFRHESGHFYWDRLVAGSAWLELFRARFGDERADYRAALDHHYAEGPPADWAGRCVSAYASAHPWEDWAETWAHYLHLTDTLDTASSFGLTSDDVEISVQPYGREALDEPKDQDAARFVRLVNAWLRLTAVLNELSRSMGQPDFYPFVLSAAAVAKLHLVHRVVRAARVTRTSVS